MLAVVAEQFQIGEHLFLGSRQFFNRMMPSGASDMAQLLGSTGGFASCVEPENQGKMGESRGYGKRLFAATLRRCLNQKRCSYRPRQLAAPLILFAAGAKSRRLISCGSCSDL